MVGRAAAPRVTVGAVAALLALTFVVPTHLATSGPVAGGALAAVVPLSNAPPVQATVTWNGVDIGSAGSVASALSTNLAKTVSVHFAWRSASAVNLSTARLEMFYFGYALSTRDVVDTNPVAALNGSFDLTWQPGAIAYLLEGSYRLTASLISTGGGAAWSESFYVNAHAPYEILAAIPILLVLIAAYELYGMLTSGRATGPRRPPSRSRSRAPAPSEEPTESAEGGTPESRTEEP